MSSGSNALQVVVPPPPSSFQRSSVESEFQLRAVWRSLRKRGRLILLLAVAGALLGFAVSKISTKMYSSTATIELSKLGGSGIGLNDLSGSSSQPTGEDLATDILTLQKEIQSDTVALSVIEQLKLSQRASSAHPEPGSTAAPGLGADLEQSPQKRQALLNSFKSHLAVTSVRDTRLTTITFTDPSPIRAAQVANAVVDAYSRSYTQARFKASSNASSWLSDQLLNLKNKVLETQKEVSDYQKRTGIVDAGEGSGADKGSGVTTDNVALNRLVELNRQLTAAEIARIPKEAIYRMSNTHDPDVVLGLTASPLISNPGPDPVLAPETEEEVGLLSSLRQHLSQLQLQQAVQDNTYGAKSPEMVKLHAEVAQTETQIQAQLVRIHQRAGSEFRLAEAYEDGLRERVAIQQKLVNQLSTGASELLVLEQEANSNRQLYQDLYAKLEEANVAAGVKASNITVVDVARVPASPSMPKTSMNTLRGFAVGALLGIFLGFLLDMIHNNIVTPEQAERSMGDPVLAVIPLRRPTRRLPRSGAGLLSSGADSPSWLLSHPASPFSEAIRSLRSSILLSRAARTPKRILFTSPLIGDGKTTVAFDTAASFALQGSKVLLLEADMRQPKLAGLLDLTTEFGLAQYLSSTRALEEVVIPYTPIHNLFLLPGGATPPMPAELLGSRRFSALLDRLSADYDMVLIDSPPLLLVGDALTLSALSEATFIVLRYNRTTEEMLRRVTAKLRAVSVRNLALILNGVSGVSSEAGSYYGKSREYEYSTES